MESTDRDEMPTAMRPKTVLRPCPGRPLLVLVIVDRNGLVPKVVSGGLPEVDWPFLNAAVRAEASEDEHQDVLRQNLRRNSKE
jgi:hypothetical protein